MALMKLKIHEIQMQSVEMCLHFEKKALQKILIEGVDFKDDKNGKRKSIAETA